MTNADVVRALLTAEYLTGWVPAYGPADGALYGLPEVSLAGDTVVIGESKMNMMGRDVLTPRAVVTFLPSGREFSVVSDYPSEADSVPEVSPVFGCLREAVAWGFSNV